MNKAFLKIFIFALTIIASASCCKTPQPVKTERSKTLLYYLCGFNSISSFLAEDLEDIKSGYLPGDGQNDDVLLIYAHLLKKGGSYSTPNSPVLLRLYRNSSGEAVVDTLVVYEKNAISASSHQLNAVLSYVKDNYAAESYGLVFSSHGYGYLPSGYYSNSEKYESGELPAPGMRSGVPVPVPYVEPETDPSLPMTKCVGEDVVLIDGKKYSYHIDITDFSDAIPMHLDYILFDACLMGGIEVAYELKDKCGMIGFSSAEILAEGFDYTKASLHLLGSEKADPLQVCKDYFEYYDSQEGLYRSATISCVDCTQLDPLAQVCARLFDKYSSAIAGLDSSKVQRYYRFNYHWFYDLESILCEAGITSEELNQLRGALDKCILYKSATPDFIGSFDISVFSGLSMFLPCQGGDYLKNFYKGLAWNKATSLVR